MIREKNREFEVSTIIGKDNKIIGDITCENGIKIDGDVKGNIESKSIISATTTAKIVGNLTCIGSCIISGIIVGNITVGGTLELKKSAKITGDITSEILIVEVGAKFDGKCTMEKKGGDK